MKPSLLAGLLSLTLAAGHASAADPPAPAPPPVVVKAGRLIDVKAGAVVANAVVLIQDGRVKAVRAWIAIPADATMIDLSGSTVLPGLIDCRTHLVADAATRIRSRSSSSSAKRPSSQIPTPT